MCTKNETNSRLHCKLSSINRRISSTSSNFVKFMWIDMFICTQKLFIHYNTTELPNLSATNRIFLAPFYVTVFIIVDVNREPQKYN